MLEVMFNSIIELQIKTNNNTNYSLIIKYLPTRIDQNQIILFELFKQVYEDILCLISCVPNNIVKEIEINKLSELNFKIMIQKNIKKDSNILKAFNYSSISCDPKPIIYQSTRCSPHQYKDIIFKINSLKLSSSSHEAIGLFMENQLTCVKIVSLKFKQNNLLTSVSF